jgi:hypothetical protein
LSVSVTWSLHHACRVRQEFAAAAQAAKESKAAGKEIPVDVAALLAPKDSVEEKLFDDGKVCSCGSQHISFLALEPLQQALENEACHARACCKNEIRV